MNKRKGPYWRLLKHLDEFTKNPWIDESEFKLAANIIFMVMGLKRISPEPRLGGMGGGPPQAPAQWSRRRRSSSRPQTGCNPFSPATNRQRLGPA